MPDTGAPWNIPYVEAADLVSDWPADSLALANAIDAGLDAAGNAGIGSNVVQTVKTDTFSASIATGAQTAVTGLTVSITPTSATSKVLVQGFVTLTTTAANSGCYITVYRGATPIGVGDAAGNRSRGTTGAMLASFNFMQDNAAFVILDSPGTASSVTYSVKVSHNSGSTATVYVNQSVTDTDLSYTHRTASSITAIEVAA